MSLPNLSNDEYETVVFENLKSSITDYASLEQLNKKLQPKGFLPLGTDLPKSLNMIDTILEKGNIKRAACLASHNPTSPDQYLVKALSPIPVGYIPPPTTLGNIYKNINRIDRTIPIHENLASQVDDEYTNPKSTACQNFYAIYCTDMINRFTQAHGGTFDADAFREFRPECACYVPVPQYIKDAGVNAAPMCFLPGCEPTGGVFMDPVSASPDTNCNLTICQANIDMGAFAAGGDIGIQNKIEQKCGSGTTGQGTVGTPTTASGWSISNIFETITSFLDPLANTSIGKTINSYFFLGTKVITYGTFAILCFVILIILIVLLFFIFQDDL